VGLTPSERFDLGAIKRERRLSDIILAAGVSLRPTGQDRFVAQCPFHDDREPSLLVDERDGHFHCFGCQAHGDVIDFVIRRDGVDFIEACRRLSVRPSQVAPAPAPERPSPTRRRWDLLTLDQQVVMNTAGAIYQHCLWREPRVLDYVRRRGLPDWVIRQCALGYADGHTLEGYLRRRSCLRVAQDLGLLRRDGSASVRSEFLSERLVIPELRGGQFVWFIGRNLGDDGPGPKYLALPGERPVLGFERAAGQREAFLCEGPFDYLVGVAWRLLARTRVIYGVLDGDPAGRAAMERFATQPGDRWRAVTLPEGCDLNDLAQQPAGRQAFFALLGTNRSHQRTEKDHGTSS